MSLEKRYRHKYSLSIIGLIIIGILINWFINNAITINIYDYDINDKVNENKLISSFSRTYCKCNLKSPFPLNSSTSQEIYIKLYNKIYENQFKRDPLSECNMDNYWIHDLHWKSGLGFMIKNIAMELILAVSRNMTFIYGPNIKEWPFYTENNKYLGMDYYFLPVTNCKLPNKNTFNVTYTSLKSLHHGIYLDDIAKQSFSSIIPNIFDSNWNWDQYNSLLMVIEYFLFLRLTKHSQKIIAKNIEESLIHYVSSVSINKNIDIKHIMKKTIAAPVRYSNVSNKCYRGYFNDSYREMVCFNHTLYIKIIELTQILYIQQMDDDIEYVILTAEDINIIKSFQLKQNKTFKLIINDNDYRPNDDDFWIHWTLKHVDDNNGNDLLLSMLTTLQLNLLSKYFILNPNSNWHLVIQLFRKYLKCGYNDYGYNDYGIDTAIYVELKSYCPRCGRGKFGFQERIVVFPKLNTSVILKNQSIQLMINKTCVKWNFTSNKLRCWVTM